VTTMLEKAISEVQKLSASEQDAIAAVILEELADERRWDEAFANSQDQLARVAAKVKEDIRAGRIKKAGIDEL
jgi:urease gamma subunit